MVQEAPPPVGMRVAPSPPSTRGIAIARIAARMRGAGLAAAVLAVITPIAAVVAFRQGALSFAAAQGFLMRGTAPVLALVAVALGVVGLVLGLFGRPRRGTAMALAIVATGAMVYALLLQGRMAEARHPPIHDVSTDWTDPPMPSPALVARRGKDAFPIVPSPSLPEGPGGVGAGVMSRQVAEVNRATCPAATPATVLLPPPEAYLKAKAALKAQGYTLVTDDPAAGRLEATARRGAWALADDVMVRIGPSGAGAKVDIRSVSRIGQADGGANCDRVARLRAALGG